jgi:hypothetical protein
VLNRFDISNIKEIVLRDRTFERIRDQAALLRATTVYRIEARLRDGSSRRLATDIITRAPRSLPDHFKRLDRLAKALARECDVPFRFTERE